MPFSTNASFSNFFRCQYNRFFSAWSFKLFRLVVRIVLLQTQFLCTFYLVCCLYDAVLPYSAGTFCGVLQHLLKFYPGYAFCLSFQKRYVKCFYLNLSFLFLFSRSIIVTNFEYRSEFEKWNDLASN